MPDTGKNAIKTYSGDGSRTNFPITFEYIKQADIRVRLAGITQTLTTHYTFSTDGDDIDFVTAPPTATDNVVIDRQTDHPAPSVTFTDSAPVTAAQLDEVLRQSLYYTEEVEDLT